MTVIIEVSGPFQARPGWYASPVMYRAYWLWFAVGVLRVPFRRFAERPWPWEEC